MGENISRRDLPEFKISKEQSDKLRAVSIITKILAEDADLTRKIANEFVKASGTSGTAASQPALARYIVMRDNISRMIAEKTKELSPERIAELYPWWYRFFIVFWYPVYYWEYYSGPDGGDFRQAGRG